MKLKIIKNYLSLDDSLNLTELRIANRKIQNRNLDILADSTFEKFNAKPKSESNLVKIVTLTANEFETISIEESYVTMES